MNTNIEDRWQLIDKCNLCGKVRPKDESWCEEHATMGISGFNFTWCPICEKDHVATGKLISDVLSNWRKTMSGTLGEI